MKAKIHPFWRWNTKHYQKNANTPCFKGKKWWVVGVELSNVCINQYLETVNNIKWPFLCKTKVVSGLGAVVMVVCAHNTIRTCMCVCSACNVLQIAHPVQGLLRVMTPLTGPFFHPFCSSFPSVCLLGCTMNSHRFLETVHISWYYGILIPRKGVGLVSIRCIFPSQEHNRLVVQNSLWWKN